MLRQIRGSVHRVRWADGAYRTSGARRGFFGHIYKGPRAIVLDIQKAAEIVTVRAGPSGPHPPIEGRPVRREAFYVLTRDIALACDIIVDLMWSACAENAVGLDEEPVIVRPFNSLPFKCYGRTVNPSNVRR